MATTVDRTLRRWRTDPGRLSFAVLVGGAAFIAAYFLVFDTATKDLLYQVPGMIAPIGGGGRHPPISARRPEAVDHRSRSGCR